MASFVKLDSTNLVQNNYNSTWKYSFPGSAANFQDVVCAVIDFDVPTAGTTSTVSVILPDGLYSYTDIIRSIQTALVNAGAYLINPSGENVFYIQLTENSVYYAAQFDFSATPTTLPTAGGTWTRPASGLYSSGGTGLPTTTRVPRIIIDNASFGKVVGLTAGTYPSASATYVASGDILSVFDRGDAQVGQLISYKPSHIYNQNDQKVKLRDTSVSIMLLLREKKHSKWFFFSQSAE
ncbi:uncharacterized protein PITG_01890 [Phytophthora infestans T30-4]|uniref:Uncharacterized protein n=1 Tax=Phytophthora infestans (strain T30-4) TaxID=403677 RepID=D0MUC1_PHYIT|nr:uncharacterized protein PITG_01890 [Phytophthora infestans T30-4]EEY61568.1 conserved hypothetical protein [Phytophthora infestans T30-4]|eukprot:XP_002908485.1 conserved hypothetical protein [Phytophthora infestans T30-4]